jgi:hypothetical protein
VGAGRADVPATAAVPPAEARGALLASAGDAATLAWKATADAAGKAASGDVVWSASQQRGYMRFLGLAPNDPKISQYQLWISAVLFAVTVERPGGVVVSKRERIVVTAAPAPRA